ncbi:hypothetical protein ASE01_17355 [Nocardioides sp. Root190]|nr:hypothetical protein ASE01_17355 [Nocardioides sp. Root190]
MQIVSSQITIHEIDGAFSLTFYCGDLPADEAIVETGHEPNGYFWEGMVQYLAPEIAEQLELDSEGGMFAANGERPALDALQSLIEPYLGDGEKVATVIREAEDSGFAFDD